MYFNGYGVAAIVCFVLALAFAVTGVLKRSYVAVGAFAICFVLTIILPAFDIYQRIEETENKTHSVIEENFKDCVFADDNTFYWNNSMYKYKLSEDENQVIIICQEDGTKNVVTYELEKSK